MRPAFRFLPKFSPVRKRAAPRLAPPAYRRGRCECGRRARPAPDPRQHGDSEGFVPSREWVTLGTRPEIRPSVDDQMTLLGQGGCRCGKLDAHQLAGDRALAGCGSPFRAPCPTKKGFSVATAHIAARLQGVGQTAVFLAHEKDLFQAQKALRFDARASRTAAGRRVEASQTARPRTAAHMDFESEFTDKADAHQARRSAATCPTVQPIRNASSRSRYRVN